MSLSRSVVLAVVAVACAIPAAARSPIANDSADRPQFKQFDANNPSLALSAGNPVQWWTGLAHGVIVPGPLRKDSDSICYSMRSYRVKRDDPRSDATTPAGYSTCQSATQFQVKSIKTSPAAIGR